jgi:hypothetical protein
MTPGAYEPLKAAKEHVTCVPLKYKSMHGTGPGYTCVRVCVWTRAFPINAQFPNMESILHEFVFLRYPDLGVPSSYTLLHRLGSS